MPVTVVRNASGYLQYRLRSHLLPGYEAKESTRYRDDRAHRDQRRQMEQHAALMSAEMKARRFNYLAWFPNGSKATALRAQAASITVGAYVTNTWLPRKQPPLVRRSTAITYAKHLRASHSAHREWLFGEFSVRDFAGLGDRARG